MAGALKGLRETADICAEGLQNAESVLLASHIDADGLTSAAIATSALERASIPVTSTFYKQLDETAVKEIAQGGFDTVLFTDFGSGQLDVILEYAGSNNFVPIVVDHHQPKSIEHRYHLNPLLCGVDGARELSGAGSAYLLALALERNGRDNCDLAGLAVVGAVGDMQASGGELLGVNQHIVDDGVEVGVLEESTDIAIYGTQTRPLPKLLEYATDIPIPGISNSSSGATRFLQSLEIEMKAGDEWRRWIDLTANEKQLVVSGLVRRAIESGIPTDRIDELVGTSYTLPNEKLGTELRDASEFSTLLNATARYERADVGLAVCLGNRSIALTAAQKLLRNHRKNLSTGLKWVKQNGVTTENHLQWFHARDRIQDTIVGIIAGMAYGSSGIDRDRPIIAFADKNDKEVKVSSRGTHRLVNRGLDLSNVMGSAAKSVGGDGGGHNVAAGATVPVGKEDEFIQNADRIVGQQLNHS